MLQDCTNIPEQCPGIIYHIGTAENDGNELGYIHYKFITFEVIHHGNMGSSGSPIVFTIYLEDVFDFSEAAMRQFLELDDGS